MEKDIYELNLHDQIKIKCPYIDFIVTKVDGGWIYTTYYENGGITTTFVPYHKWGV